MPYWGDFGEYVSKKGDIMANSVRKMSNMFLIEGIFALVVGVMLLVLPAISSFALSVVVSVGLILVGIHKFISSIVRRDEIEKSWLQMLIAVLLIGVGIYMTMNPLFNMLILTMGIALYLILEGISSMSIAIQSKEFVKYWWVGLFAAAAQFVLAALIIYFLPATALLVIAVMVGVNLIFSGVTLISVYAGAKKLLTAC